MGGVTIARPTLAMRRTYSWTSSTASFAQVSSFNAKLAAAPGQPQLAVLQLLDAIADRGGLLELEVCRPPLHLLLHPPPVAAHPPPPPEPPPSPPRCRDPHPL